MSAKPVPIYSKPSCVQCDAIYWALEKHGIAYDVADLTQDPTASSSCAPLVTSRSPSSSPATTTGPDSAPTRSPR
jgi:glutaredoxin-like protein NrdH